MSVERSQSSQNNNPTQQVDEPRDRPRNQPREQPKAEQVDRFRTLMQSRGEAKLEQPKTDLGALLEGGQVAEEGGAHTATNQAVLRKDTSEDGAQQQAGGDTLQPAELAALYQAQVLAREVPVLPTATPAAHANPQALADMLERHVRQLAISPNGVDHDKGQILLRLNDATLPGTDLLLSRTETGWLLRADVRSRSSFDAIQQAAPQLAERFASRNLGALEVDPHFHG